MCLTLTRGLSDGVMQVVVDGKLEFTRTGVVGQSLSGTPRLGLGCNPCNQQKSLAADYDELRLYTRILTAAESAQRAAAP